MTKMIESYNASYPAAYYEIGTIYAFYAGGIVKGTPATSEEIQRFSSVLKGLDARQNENAIQPVKDSDNEPPSKIGRLTRHYAVVVKKNATSIEVMFLNKCGSQESYLTKKYAVNGSARTDGKDLMAPTTYTNIGETIGGKIVGGITRIGKDGGVGGITRVGKDILSTEGIGGITKVNKDKNILDATVKKIGGITKIKK